MFDFEMNIWPLIFFLYKSISRSSSSSLYLFIYLFMQQLYLKQSLYTNEQGEALGLQSGKDRPYLSEFLISAIL